jgi:hypothetical protein
MQGADTMPEELQEAYHEALQTFNAGVWPGAATLCRRTLEGAVADLLPSEDTAGDLASRLERVAKSKTDDLAKPLMALANAVRQGGNLGAHFTKGRRVTPEAAEALLNLTEYLLEYVYALPAMIEALQKKLAEGAAKETK